MRVNEKIIGGVLIAIGALSLITSLMQGRQPVLPAEETKAESSRVACKVLTVYDGDTLGCDLNGNRRIERPEEEIRLLGIDSPEMHYSKKNKTHGSAQPVDEPMAKAASQWLEQQAARKTVYLEFDRKRADRYGRTLAYVYATPHAEASLNEQQLLQGYAKTLFIGQNRCYESRFAQAETKARQGGRGLWKATPSCGDTEDICKP